MDETPTPGGISGRGMVTPICAIGALSQAWFDALGLARPKNQTAARAPVAAEATHTAVPQPRYAKAPSEEFAHSQSILARGERKFTLRIASANAARIERPQKIRVKDEIRASSQSSHDHERRSAGRITIRTTRGVVRMLVQRDGTKMHLTAVCDPAAIGAVSDALAAAGRKLHARGIGVQAQTHGAPH